MDASNLQIMEAQVENEQQQHERQSRGRLCVSLERNSISRLEEIESGVSENKVRELRH